MKVKAIPIVKVSAASAARTTIGATVSWSYRPYAGDAKAMKVATCREVRPRKRQRSRPLGAGPGFDLWRRLPLHPVCCRDRQPSSSSAGFSRTTDSSRLNWRIWLEADLSLLWEQLALL